MIAYYRIPGLISIVALLIYAILDFAILSAMGATLTLPGIAGFILTIGMAVDANVLIFERVKEEIRRGRNYVEAIPFGFDRAFSSIVDSNVTTIIGAVVLFWLGTGTIKGFAITLITGILVSMFSAIVLTRFMMEITKNAKIFNNHLMVKR
jgi:preprotein translocase subunit SecD